MTAPNPSMPEQGPAITPKALCISIYPSMGEEVARLAGEVGVQVDVYSGGIFNNGHLYAREMQEHYDVVISQAGTAVTIQSMVDIPVISIPITAADFIVAFREARKYGRPVTLISFRGELCDDLNAMSEFLLGERFTSLTYSSKEDYDDIVAHAMQLKGHTLIGFGSCIRELASANNLPYVLVESGRHSVRQALVSAKEIIEQNFREKQRSRRLQNLINNSREGIISVYRERNITLCNITAERILGLKDFRLTNCRINSAEAPEALRALYGDGGAVLNELLQVGGLSLIMSRFPLMDRSRHLETMITFQELSQIQKVEATARAQLHLKGLVAKYKFKDIIRSSECMQKLLHTAQEYAATEAAVLIEGETGTGKELLAQSIHNSSGRAQGPFVAINCAALPEHLLESELFGYAEGAFTGAKKGGKAGMFELAHNGTIFLDEIGEISLGMQSRLLRVLQEKEVFRLGGERVINVDVRVISATNINLYKRVEEGLFRRDLFFRLNLLPLYLPPLRQRPEDIPLLINFFLVRNKKIYGDKGIRLSPGLLRLMQNYRWPGNVREVANIVERISAVYQPGMNPDALAERVLSEHISMQERYLGQDRSEASLTIPLGTLKEMERSILEFMFERLEGNQSRMAEDLGLSRVTVWKKLKEMAGQDKGTPEQ